jgi:UDP-glucose:(heptosyl)LPS alpha-1,3-glucosyltransferase
LTLRLAVVSPFLDRRHGTERCVIEQLERFVSRPDVEIHVYSERIEDVAGFDCYPIYSPGRICWHAVPRLRGPHIFGYLWWLIANQGQRWWDAKVRGLEFDVIYSAGINAFDADAIAVHVIFAELSRRVRARLRLRSNSSLAWPLVIHRRLYYRLICGLEKIIYPRRQIGLAAFSRHASESMKQLFGRDDVAVIRHGVDMESFQASARLGRRESARTSFRIKPEEFGLLLIGNDWRNKGLDALLQAVAECSEAAFVVLVVGSDEKTGVSQKIGELSLESQVRFLEPSGDVMQFYAAADAYVGPSLEDAYGLPILEAMACGLPVIASARAGASEIVRHGENGFVLQNPEDSRELAELLRRLYADAGLRKKMGEEAARTAEQETWDRNAEATWEFLNDALARKRRG